MFTWVKITCSIMFLQAALGVYSKRPPVAQLHFPRNARDEKRAIPSGIASHGGFTTSMPSVSNYSSLADSTCLLNKSYCTLQGSDHALDGLRDICVAWDNSCSGNPISAGYAFYSNQIDSSLPYSCFWTGPSPECTTSNPPGRMSAFAGLKSWMRGQQCSSIQSAFMSQKGDAYEIEERSCCGQCLLFADRVDIYYFQDPNADTSCLSIIGSGIHGLMDGATTSGGSTYWDCTTYGFGSMEVVQKAAILTDASVTYKAVFFDPWDDSGSLCMHGTQTRVTIRPNATSSNVYGGSVSTRIHSMTINKRGVTTFVSGQHTL